MKIEGIWKAVGRFASHREDLSIKDGIMEYSDWDAKKRKKEYILTECNSYKNLAKETMFISLADEPKRDDMIIHVEEHDGHLISILSFMTMEYDGRGLIVISEYVHEDDYQYVPKDFSSNIYHYRNDREASPMRQMDTSDMLGMNMFQMMNMQGSGQVSSLAGGDAVEPSDMAAGDEWTCSCGQVNRHSKFCGMCGMKKPSAD